jgi:predicted Fe-Mo cluster-binding NifX family protein
MRIAVASEGTDLSSKVDPRLGRAKYIIVYDTRNNEWEVLDNREVSQLAGGSGIKAAEAIVNKNVDYVVSQNFGPKALDVFRAADVKAAVLSDATVAEAIELTKRNRLNVI